MWVRLIMSSDREIFESNDLRKSERFTTDEQALVKDLWVSVENWSFEGIGIRDFYAKQHYALGHVVDVEILAPPGSPPTKHFLEKARLVWINGRRAGFAWVNLTESSRGKLLVLMKARKFSLVVHRDHPVVKKPSAITATRIEPLPEPAVEAGLQKHRRLRSMIYLVTALCFLAVAGVLLYQNQFVYSARAIYPGNLITVSSGVEGVIESVTLKAGDAVGAGDVIARFDASNIESQYAATKNLLDQRQSAVSMAELAVKETIAPQSMYTNVAEKQLATARANVDEAEADYKAKENDYLRLDQLDRQGLIGRSQLDRAIAELKRAGARLQGMREQLVLAQNVLQEAKNGRYFNGSRVNNDAQVIQVDLAQRQSELAQANLELTRVESARDLYQVKAAQAGKIFSLAIRPGQYVKKGEAMAVIEAAPQPYVVANFGADDVKSLVINQQALVYARGGGPAIAAHVVSIGHTSLPQDYALSSLLRAENGEVAVGLELESIPADFYPGASLEVKVVPGFFSGQ